MTDQRSPRAVHQFHSGSAPGDAVTGQMLAWQAILRAEGYDSEVFAEHVHPTLRGRIRPIASYLGDPEALLVVHHSIGHGAFDLVSSLPDGKILSFHNITPAEFFEDEWTRRFVRLGHRQLRRLQPQILAAVANSAYSRRELVEAGYRRATVIPVRTSFDVAAAAGPRSSDWLFVGRLVPNKCQAELVGAFAHHAGLDPSTRLHLIGDLSFTPYVDEVRALIRRHGIEHRVVIHGKVTDDQLRDAYASAGVFVCLSKHEGFGVPLLEAMAAGVPVVARASAAVPETMGGAGVLLHDETLEEVAAVVRSLLADPELRSAVVAGQRQRIEAIGRFDVTGALRSVIAEALGDPPPIEIRIEGPFETSYSLAQLNRRLAVELSRLPGLRVSIKPTEGPGDYDPDPDDLARHPEAAALYERLAEVPTPDVTIRQMYPPRVHDAQGAVNLLYFGWEETRVPQEYVDRFNRHLDGIGTMSAFVVDALRESGCVVDAEPVGVGVDPFPDTTLPLPPELDDLPGFRFLNVSSAFPRKGVDVLLAAYAQAFTGRDDVTLVLKTFPNPHNEVASLLERMRSEHPDPPDVRWIDRDLDDVELAALFRAASCYVHASRGEGYGLPVAEAMLERVPVVAVAQSGTADFVDDDVSRTVPWSMAPAASHVTVPGGRWAEPDRPALASAMRAAFEGRDPERTVKQVARADERIRSEHSWPAVARRWSSLIEAAPERALRPEVAMVSTWNSRCGIAEYSRHLIDGFHGRAGFRVFGELDVPTLDPRQERHVTRAWRSWWEPDLTLLRDELLASEADVVHVQFNFGFHEVHNLGNLLELLRRDGRATVVTLHATHEPTIEDEVVSLGDIALQLSRVSALVVHQAKDAEALSRYGLGANVHVIPHGASVGGTPAPRQTREALGFGQRPIIGTFGFILPHKGTLELIRAVGLLRRSVPDVLLVGCSALHPDPSSAAYLEECRREVARLHLGDHVLLIPDFLADVEARTILSASDVIVLPYAPTPESASGALRAVIGVGPPVVTTDLPIFADAAGALDRVASNDPAVLAGHLGTLLRQPRQRAELAERCAEYARSVSWSTVARTHLDLYRAVTRRARAGSLPAR